MIVSKLSDRQPFYHQEKKLEERYQMLCSRQTIARWAIQLQKSLQPIYNLLIDRIIEYDIASMDATWLQVLREPGRKARTKSYAYCIRGGPPKERVVTYGYNAVDHKHYTANWFEGFEGTIHTDGDNFFDLLGNKDGINLSFCNYHARRKFEPVAKAAKKPGLAAQVMAYYKELSLIEEKAKNMTSKQRHELRQEKALPLMKDLKRLLEENENLVLKKSPLGKAVTYTLKRWEGLTLFLKDGRLEVSNNLTEQEIKPFVICRKNFLFCTSIEGANALCLHLSLIRTARLHKLDPYDYYVNLLKKTPACKTAEDYENLLPWNIQLDEKIRPEEEKLVVNG